MSVSQETTAGRRARDTTINFGKANPQPREVNDWSRVPSSIDLGTAGEHIVCADILMQGLRASTASPQLPYDLVLDVGGKLYRVAVKATSVARSRPTRMGSRPCYQFCITRSREGAQAKRYLVSEIDIIALVALDCRRVAYLPISEYVTVQHIDSPEHPTSNNKFGPKSAKRKQFDDLPLRRAVEALGR